jgi:hypothetical protein
MSAPAIALTLIKSAEAGRIRDVADQLDLLAYLAAKAADPVRGQDLRPRSVDLRLPSGGMEALLRRLSTDLLQVLDEIALHDEGGAA